jgi:hypothetical protein
LAAGASVAASARRGRARPPGSGPPRGAGRGQGAAP